MPIFTVQRKVFRLVAGFLFAFSVGPSVLLRAEDIVLKDGRVFQDAKVVDQSPSRVTIRYAGGMSIVEKTLLPDKLIALYPLDPGIVAQTKAIGLAFESTKEAAAKGDASAQFNLGTLYDSGAGVAKNRAEAFKWYQMAASQGNVYAEFNLGVSFHNGDGVARDDAEAIKWYRKAADQGYGNAEYCLGLMYHDGTGVTRDVAEAIKWYKKAAEQGFGVAAFHLALIYDDGDGVQADSSEAVDWYREAAIRGNVSAQINLGYMYSHGEGVAKDEVEGLAWTYIAAASGADGLAVKNRDVMEDNVGREMAIVAQQRSTQISKEIADLARDRQASPSKESAIPNSPIDDSVKATGSGAIVSADGVVLTAAHVVAGGKMFRVKTAQGIREAKILGIDEANDLAALKIDGGPYLPLSVISSRGIRLGQSVATIGFPETELQGFSPKVTRGEISSLNGYRDDIHKWQISVPIQLGNSGGPLLDENGNLIGIIASKLSLEAVKDTGDLLENVNYAVKASYALPLLDQYLPENLSTPRATKSPLQFEDMVAKAQQSVVLILVY